MSEQTTAIREALREYRSVAVTNEWWLQVRKIDRALAALDSLEAQAPPNFHALLTAARTLCHTNVYDRAEWDAALRALHDAVEALDAVRIPFDPDWLAGEANDDS